ncbi:MAG: hypothetical protein IT376_02070 [Polyangiaceae bacterium]|nr:hypothetical protein [Polyangiaceae bacterium]
MTTPAEPREVAVDGPVVSGTGAVLASRPVLALFGLALLVGVAELAPGLEALRVLSPRPGAAAPVATPPHEATSLAVGEAVLPQETTQRAELAQPEHAEAPGAARGPIGGRREEGPKIDAEKPPVPIVDAGHRGLGGFYRALERTIAGQPGAVTRVVHFGDSIITSDFVSGTLRRKLQARFGDAGHGFMLLANPWPAYFHNDVTRFASAGWAVSRIVGPRAADGLYGLGGVTFTAPPGSRARFGTAREGRYGRAVSRFVLAYLARPGGGKLRLLVDGQEREILDTAGPEPRVAYHTIGVPDGPHELEVVTISGATRAFGVVMEREGPGVVLDAIGVQGARVRFLDEQDDAHWADQLRWRQPALLAYQFGANESGDGFVYPMADYNRTLQAVLRQGREAVPDAGCLVIGAMDRVEKRGESLTTLPVIPALVEEQRRGAAAVGCAFFDTYAAMGGSGSMATWVGRGLGQADLTHPTGAGSEVLASWIERALLDGLERWRAAGAPAP